MLKTSRVIQDARMQGATPRPPAHSTVRNGEAMSRALETLKGAAPQIYRLLQESDTLESARHNLYAHLQHRERELYSHSGALHPLEYATARQCLQVLKDILAPRNEAQAGFSTLSSLWRTVRGVLPGGEGIEEGFVLEFVHLFKGLDGCSGIAKGWLEPQVFPDGEAARTREKLEGRAAGRARSEFLDRIGQRMLVQVKRYPTGLDPDLVAQRKRNKQRILDFFGAESSDWESYTWQLGHLLKGASALAQLEQLIPMTEAEKAAIHLSTEHGIPFGITPYYLSLFDFESAGRETDAVVRAQVIPPMHYVEQMIEHGSDREYYFDFMGEHDTSPIDLVTRRYATIAILKGYDTCPQICVYCQRNWEITGPMEPGALPPRQKLDDALDWFAEHPTLRDVLITGGDPFFLSDRRIEYMLDRLAAMPHIANIRWGTRSLVTLPMRVTAKLAELLGRYLQPGRRNIGVVTHIEAAAEITPELAAAVHRLRKQGLYVYNQQVFTLHTSRRFQTVANRIAMKKVGVDPYYTFYPKGKQETRDYTTPLARILQERKEEARLLPGSFRTDEPVFNVPRLGKNHVRAAQDRELIAIRPDGRRVYLWHPWEKGIAAVKPWLYLDNSIQRYLKDLEQIGENRADYASIWYYY